MLAAGESFSEGVKGSFCFGIVTEERKAVDGELSVFDACDDGDDRERKVADGGWHSYIDRIYTSPSRVPTLGACPAELSPRLHSGKPTRLGSVSSQLSMHRQPDRSVCCRE